MTAPYAFSGHPLDGPRLRIIRAREHLDAFNRIFNTYKARKPYLVVGNLNTDETLYSYSIKMIEPPPLDLGVEVGEALYNLRTALDHLAWQLAIVGLRERGEVKEPVKHTEFPIHWERPIAAWKIRDLPPQAQDLIDQLQPYQRGNAAKSDLLWMLHELNIVDKHRLFNWPTPAVTYPLLGGGIQQAIGPLNYGDVFARVPAHLKPKEDFEPHIQVVIRFAEGGPAGGEGLAVLDRIYDYVRDGVIPRFAGFFTAPCVDSPTSMCAPSIEPVSQRSLTESAFALRDHHQPQCTYSREH